MKNRPLVITITLVFVALFTWSLLTTIGASVKGGREEFMAWRSDNITLYYGIWVATMVVVGAPALYFVGRELARFADRQEETALAAKGVGRFAAKALRGDKGAIEKLVSLLDDPTPVVRYQAARALALVDDPPTNKELFRKVRYWDVDLKLGLINALKRTSDVRTAKLMGELAKDRNPMVARRASTAMPLIGGKATSMDWLVEQRKRESEKREKKAAKRRAAPATVPPADEPSEDAAEPSADELSEDAAEPAADELSEDAAEPAADELAEDTAAESGGGGQAGSAD